MMYEYERCEWKCRHRTMVSFHAFEIFFNLCSSAIVKINRSWIVFVTFVQQIHTNTDDNILPFWSAQYFSFVCPFHSNT